MDFDDETMYELGYDSVIGFFYDVANNFFVDENGFIVYNMFEFITPNDMFLFKKDQEYVLCNHKRNRNLGVELYYPDDAYIRKTGWEGI